MGNEIVKKEETALAQYNYGEDAGSGFGDLRPDDYKIPLVYLLQPMSPQLRENKKLSMGQLWNNVTEEAVESFEGVIVGMQRTWVEKTGKAAGGEFVARHDDSSDFVIKALAKRKSKFGAIPLPDGNTLEESVCLFFMHPDLSFSGLVLKLSGLDAYKKLMTRLDHWSRGNGRAPIYGTRVKVSTTEKEFEHGTAYVPVFTPADEDFKKSAIAPDSELYLAAKSLSAMINSGKATVVETAKAESDEDNCLA